MDTWDPNEEPMFFTPSLQEEAGYQPWDDCPYGPDCKGTDCPSCGGPPYHDCPKDAFLEDPITQAYGVGSEMVSLIPCAVCEAQQSEEPPF